MFTVEAGKSKYALVRSTDIADKAIAAFIDLLDLDKDRNIRIVMDGIVMARHTPKGNYIHPMWR